MDAVNLDGEDILVLEGATTNCFERLLAGFDRFPTDVEFAHGGRLGCRGQHFAIVPLGPAQGLI